MRHDRLIHKIYSRCKYYDSS